MTPLLYPTLALAAFVALPLLGGAASPGAPSAPPRTVVSNQCESLAGSAISAWNRNVKPEIDEFMEDVGRTVSTFRNVRDDVDLAARATRAAAGTDWNRIADDMMDAAVNELVTGVQSSWSDIGPQALDLPGRAEGRITPVVGTTRMFITPPNLTHARTRITVTKLDGRQRAEIVICKAPYDDPGNYTRVRVLEFDNGLANVGDSQSVTIDDAHGWYVTVKVRKFVGTNAFAYRVRTETVGATVLD